MLFRGGGKRGYNELIDERRAGKRYIILPKGAAHCTANYESQIKRDISD